MISLLMILFNLDFISQYCLYCIFKNIANFVCIKGEVIMMTLGTKR